MGHITQEMVREWFILRFGRMPEHDRAYFDEWKNRFARGGEEAGIGHMDSESQRKWEKVKSAHKLKLVA